SLTWLLPMLADTIEVVAVELQGHGRTSTSFDRSATRAWPPMGQPAPGARPRVRLVPGDGVGGAVTLQLAPDRPELADHVVPRFDHLPGAKDDSPMMRVGPWGAPCYSCRGGRPLG